MDQRCHSRMLRIGQIMFRIGRLKSSGASIAKTTLSFTKNQPQKEISARHLRARMPSRGKQLQHHRVETRAAAVEVQAPPRFQTSRETTCSSQFFNLVERCRQLLSCHIHSRRTRFCSHNRATWPRLSNRFSRCSSLWTSTSSRRSNRQIQNDTCNTW
jgi:hypothetical protein